ncbi:hypothetical protein KEJ28_04085 [Candidatus Bathyarchaeota archaeon]|nr:hypothetical protein [Candidatus Bathyarchaeota archaeon]
MVDFSVVEKLEGMAPVLTVYGNMDNSLITLMYFDTFSLENDLLQIIYALLNSIKKERRRSV